VAGNDFAFTRFKYRVMSKTQEPRSFRAYLANILADKQRAESAKIMAGYGLALLAHAENNHDRALTELAQVINAYPDENILQVDKGVFLFTAGRIAEAEQVLRNALHNDSNNMYAAFTLGKLLYRTGRLDEAEEYFNRVRYELPEYAKVYFEIGQIAADRKERGAAAFSLGKYNLYEGKLPLAEHHLHSALRDKELPEKMRAEAQELQKKIALLQK
jgi:predicted Zn-dependent protease